MFMANSARIVTNDDGRICDMARVPDATVDDLYLVGGKAELVNGELVIMTPGGDTHGYAAGVIYASLLN